MRFELFKGGIFRRRWYWRLVAGNNEIVAQSEGYVDRASAIGTCRSIRYRMNQKTPIMDEDRNPIPDVVLNPDDNTNTNS